MWRMRAPVSLAMIAMLAPEASSAQTGRAPAPPTAPAVPTGTIAPLPAHNVGVRLASTPLYDLYEYRMQQGWCRDGFAAVAVLFKVEPSYEVAVDAEYRARFEREIAPLVRAQCPTLRRISVFNHVKGFILSGGSVYTYEQADRVQRETPLSSFIVQVDATGALRFPADVGGVRSIAAAQARAESIRASNVAYDAQRTREREEAARAEARLSALTRTSDGLLRLDGFSNEHKKLFGQIYDGEFVELTRVDRPHYRPFQVYTALLQAYGDKCRSRLADPVAVRFYGENRVRTDVGAFVQTDFYKEHLLGTVWVERALEPAYRTAGSRHLTRMGEYWQRNVREDLLGFYTAESLGGIGLAKATHGLVELNGCASQGLGKFIATLTAFVSDRWAPPTTADGGYRYAEEERLGDFVRRYEKVPAGFRPPFPVVTTKPIVVLLNESTGGNGLSMVQVRFFSHAPLAAKGQISRIAGMTAAVRAAIDERKYQVAECTYLRNGGSTTDFFWNANAPLPSAEVRTYFDGVIGEARTECPAVSSRG